MTVKTTGLLLSALNDLEQPFSAELDEAATRVTSCLNNVLQSASGRSNGAAAEAKARDKVENFRKYNVPVSVNTQLFPNFFFDFHVTLSNLKLY